MHVANVSQCDRVDETVTSLDSKKPNVDYNITEKLQKSEPVLNSYTIAIMLYNNNKQT